MCDEDVFRNTYEQVGDPNGHEYRKTGSILARQMDQSFTLKTQGTQLEHGKVGDYLVQNESGDQYIIAAQVFESTYERVD